MAGDDLSGPAAYSLYDLLRTLVERVGWPTEEEKRAALGSIGRAENAAIFGNLAAAMVCDHPGEAVNPSTGVCEDCGRQVIKPMNGPPRYQRGGRI